MSDTEVTAEQILDAALNLAEVHGWEKLHLFQVADAMGITLDDIRRHYAQKDDLVDAWFDRADQAMLTFASREPLHHLPPLERYKRILIAWLDALAPHQRVTGDMLLYKLEPAHIHLQVGGVLRISRTVQWMREATANDSTHLRRIAEEIVDTGIYLSTFLFWLRDHSADFADTRRHLDRQINRAKALDRLFPGR